MAATVSEQEPLDHLGTSTGGGPAGLEPVSRASWRQLTAPSPGLRRAGRGAGSGGRGGSRPRPPRPAGPTLGSVIAAVLGLIALLAVTFAGYLFVGSRLDANRAQSLMFDDLVQQLSLAEVPVCGVVPDGQPVGLVEIRSIGLEQAFVVGAASEQTLLAPGLRHDSVFPGQQGLSVLVGRRVTGGAPFRDLDRVQPGDVITATTGHGVFRYVVDLVRTSDAPPTEVPIVPSRLTLVTSDPAYAPNRTLSVSAALDGDALPACTGTASVAADQPGAGSRSGAVGLLLWSQGLLVAAAAVTWLAARLPKRALWIGATPLLLALSWQVSAHLAVLLPNTL